MSLIISTGSNLGDRKSFLDDAKKALCALYDIEEESQIYESSAVDYLNQPDFLNQVISFKTPKDKPLEVLKSLMVIEKEMGRKRDIDKGPRTIDLDMLFWDLEKINTQELIVPHPRLFERSFIVKPLRELKAFHRLRENFDFKEKFDNSCWVFKS
jgi:2-amino-4-hydroxy-6-hydroxymethyldihydropteridine diphosphokinase